MTEPGVRPTGSDAGLKLWDGIVKLGLGLRVILLPMSPGLERHPTLVSLPGKVNSSMNRFLTALAVAVLNLGAVSPASASPAGSTRASRPAKNARSDRRKSPRRINATNTPANGSRIVERAGSVYGRPTNTMP